LILNFIHEPAMNPFNLNELNEPIKSIHQSEFGSMNLLTFFLFLCVCSIVRSETHSLVSQQICGWVGSNYIRVAPNTSPSGQINNYTITSGLCSKMGWSALGFSNTGLIKDSYLTVMIYIDVTNNSSATKCKVMSMPIHGNMSSLIDLTNSYQATLITSVNTIYNVLETSFIVPSSDLNFGNFSFIHFACADDTNPPKENPDGGWTVTTHTTVLGAYISTFGNVRSSCDLVLNVFPRLADLSVPVFCIEFVIYLCAIPLWFFLREYEPLRSRSIVPVTVAIFLYGITMSSSLLHLMDLTHNTIYQCKLYGLILMPASLILSSLMFLNYLRYILIVNINKNKEYLHEGKVPLSFKLIKVLKSLSSLAMMAWIVAALYTVCAVFYICIAAIWTYDCTAIQYMVITIPLYLSTVPIFMVAVVLV
jgi:hypothetical protein